MARVWIIAVTAGLLSLNAGGQGVSTPRLQNETQGCDGASKPFRELDYAFDKLLGKSITGTTFEVKLLTIIDSGKNKPGKKVTAVVTDGGASIENAIIPHNAKIIGHLAEVQKRDKTHTEARVRLVFDQIRLKHGKTLTFVGVVHKLSAEHIANTQYWEPSEHDPLGHWVRIDDWPDGDDLAQYCYSDDASRGVLITSSKSNIHLGFHTLLALRVVPAQRSD